MILISELTFLAGKNAWISVLKQGTWKQACLYIYLKFYFFYEISMYVLLLSEQGWYAEEQVWIQSRFQL